MPPIGAIFGAIAGAIGAVGSFIGGLGVIGKAVLAIGLNLAVSAISSAFAPKPQQPVGGVELDTQYGGDQDRIVRMGRWGIAGHYTYANTYGGSNKYLQQIYTVSDFRCTSLDKVWIDGELATLGTADGDGYRPITNGDYANLIKVKFVDGTQTAAEDTLVDNATPTTRWTENHVGLGICYIVCRLTYDREKLGQTVQFFFEGKGAPLYDFRKDDTVGGSGDHRWSDPDTWEFTENPVLMDYAYRRGLSVNGDPFCGMFEDASRLPLSLYSAAANVCDEDVEGEPRYRCAIGINCNAEHGNNIDALMRSCGGIVVHGVDGVWPIIGTDQTPVATLTDDDLIVGEPVRVQFRRPANELVNSVSGTYPDPDNIWSPAGYQRATDSSIVTIDRRSKDVSMNFETVPYGRQASQLAAIYFSENRFEATAQKVVRPRWQVLEPGDWIVWDSARYGTKTFMVTDLSLVSLHSDKPRCVSLTLQERSGDIYEAVGVTLPDAPVPPGTQVFQQELVDFSAVGVIGSGANGLLFPMIRVSWSAPADPTVAEIVLFWRVKTGPGPTFSRTVPAATTVAVLNEGVVSNTEYEVWHQIVADPARPTSPTVPIKATSPSAPSRDVAVTLAELQQDAYGSLASMRQALDDLQARIEQTSGNASLDTAERFIERRQIKKTQGALSAAVTTETQARVDGDTALASSLTEVEAKADNASASGLYKIEASAGTGDVVVAATEYLRATLGDDYLEAGERLEIYDDDGTLRSRKLINVDQWVVWNGSVTVQPMAFEDGELLIQNIRFGTGVAGILQDDDELTVFNLNTGTLTFSEVI